MSLLQNVSIGIVGKDMEFTIYDDDDVASFLEGLEERPQRKVLPTVQNALIKLGNNVDVLL